MRIPSQLAATLSVGWTVIAAAAPPEWLWGEGDRNGTGTAELGTTFDLPELPSDAAELRAIGDFCSYRISINGHEVARAEPYDDALMTPIKAALKAGRNRIAVRASGVDGPSAVALELAFVSPGGARRTFLRSTGTWPNASSIAPLAELAFEGARYRDVDAFAEYNQWKEAKAGSDGAVFSPLPDGFLVERLRVAKPDEGSWVSMVFDTQGRLVLAREKRGLVRFAMEGGKFSGEPELIDDTLLECRGLAFAADGSLLANANNSKQLYRLRPKGNSGDTFHPPEPLMASGGKVGHGRNDLAAGGRDRVYSIHGDSVQLPDDLLRRVPQPAARQPAEGHLVRLRPDGSDRELMCTGLRNPFGIAINPDGEAFTYDADNEGDVGLPFYRPARVNHLVSGADYGWRQGSTWSWPTYAPQSLPTTFDLGRGSPTAVEFGTKSNFPPRYRDALFVLDWAYGRIIALDLIPRGASYAARAHTFLRGRPLNVTDLAFGPDGAMYFVTGGRKTQSSLYRVRYTGPPIPERERTAQEQARSEFSARARQLRGQLGSYHGLENASAIRVCWPQLDNPDPWLRHAAMVGVQSQPAGSWSGRALQQRSLPALLALARISADPPREEILTAVKGHDFARLSRRDQLCALRVIELVGSPAIGHLKPHFPNGIASVDRELAKLLIAWSDPDAVGHCLDLLSAANTGGDKLYYLHVLSGANAGWDPQSREAFFAAIRYPDYFPGDRNMPAFLKRLRDRAIATLSEAEQAALGDRVHPAEAEGSTTPEPQPVLGNWSVDDLLAASPNGDVSPDTAFALFDKALCSHCHQLRGRGKPLGPDLTHASARFGKRDLAGAIVNPSAAIAEIFRNVAITKKDGEVVTGRIVRDDFRKSTLSLSPNPFAPEQLVVVSKHDIASTETSPASPMPPGLLNTLTLDQAATLIDFILGGGGE